MSVSAAHPTAIYGANASALAAAVLARLAHRETIVALLGEVTHAGVGDFCAFVVVARASIHAARAGPIVPTTYAAAVILSTTSTDAGTIS